MITLTDSLVSSSARNLPLRMRPDLSARVQRYQGRVYWVIKDPLGLNYYRFQEEEYAILEMLDGQTSMDGIKERFEDEFPPQKITVEEVAQLVGMLHKSGLVIADLPGQGLQLKKRSDKRKRQQLLQTLSNVLCIQFKGIDPDRLLGWLLGYVGWFFTRTALVLCLIMFASALSLVLVQFDIFRARLPGFHDFFGPKNWLMLAAAMGVTKVLHEFGHGLSCKHFGGECHEMGVLILVLTPCLYCNVSDSWMLPSKWQRAAIGAAGMYVELCIASIATFIWWFSEPGLLNNLCLSTMFVCSVSTLMFNANPLLRYDGYYILSDLVEIPNLRQKASTILSRKLGAWCLGLEEQHDPFLPQRNQVIFAIYSVASAVYRWVVVFSILWFLYKVFEPYRLKVIGQMIAMVAIGGLVVQPAWQVGKFFYVPGKLHQIKRVRLFASLGVIVAALLGVLLIPLPYRVICPVEVKARDAASVYVDVPGILTKLYVKAGQKVQAGELLAELINIDLDLEVERLRGQRNSQQSQYDSLLTRRFTDPHAQGELPQVEKSLESVKEQLRKKEQDVARLRIVAPMSGTILPPPENPERPNDDSKLSIWSGTPLDEKNIGAYLQQSILFCQIGDPHKMEGMVIVDQADIELVHEQQPVDIKLDQLPHETLSGRIAEVSRDVVKYTPRSLSNKVGGELVTKTDPTTGADRPQNTSYEASVPLDDEQGVLRLGLRGRAKIHVQWQTLGGRLWRYLTQTFHFKM